jgi:hypothetical protein
MTAAAALRDGNGRVARAPVLVALMWLLSVFVAVPLMLAVRSSIESHLGASLEADRAASGVNYDWMQEFSQQASGLAATFTPNVIGFAAVLDNFSALLENQTRPLGISVAVMVYMGLSLFFAGGIIDRYARLRPTRAHEFFSVSGVFFFRFIRLAVIAGSLYVVMFEVVHPWLFDTAYTSLTRNVTAERTAALLKLAFYLLFGGTLAGISLLFDYAKVRAVVEDRRSMIAAAGAALKFLARNGRAALGLYLLNVVVLATVVAAYALTAPGAGTTGWSMWVALAVGQIYVVLRVWVKLLFWASETALFQGRLAHAGYVARPAPRWPESPSVEAIERSS